MSQCPIASQNLQPFDLHTPHPNPLIVVALHPTTHVAIAPWCVMKQQHNRTCEIGTCKESSNTTRRRWQLQRLETQTKRVGHCDAVARTSDEWDFFQCPKPAWIGSLHTCHSLGCLLLPVVSRYSLHVLSLDCRCSNNQAASFIGERYHFVCYKVFILCLKPVHYSIQMYNWIQNVIE
jgi:hypothetical protein